MRILICTDPDTIHSKRFVESLSRKAKVALFWFGDKRDFSGYHIPCFPLARREPVNVRWLGRFLREYAFFSTLVFFRPTLIHIHREAWWCKKFKQWAPRTPIVFTSWGHVSSDLLTGHWSQQIALADGLTADSPSVLDELLGIRGCASKPASIIRFGVSEEMFHPAPPSQVLKEELNIPGASRLVYSARSLRPVYNHETLMRAIPFVLKQIPNVYFIFVNNHGHRYPEAVEYRNKLINESNELGVSSHVRFLEHNEDRLRVATLFQTADVVVSIPVEDAFPATIFEAMACGTPLIVSNLHDYDGVVDDLNSVRIASTDVKGLAEALQMLLTDDVKRSKLCMAGLQTVASKGKMETEISNLLDFYRALIGDRR